MLWSTLLHRCGRAVTNPGGLAVKLCVVSLLHLCGLAVTTLWLRGERVAKVTFSPLKCFSNRVTSCFI